MVSRFDPQTPAPTYADTHDTRLDILDSNDTSSPSQPPTSTGADAFRYFRVQTTNHLHFRVIYTEAKGVFCGV